MNSISFSRVIRPVWLTWTGLKTAPTSSPRLATTSCCSGTLRYVGRFPTEPPWGTWSGLPSPASSVSTPLAFGQKPSTEQVIQKLVPIHNVSKGVKPNSKNWLFYVIYNRAFGRRNFREMCLLLLGRAFVLAISKCVASPFLCTHLQNSRKNSLPKSGWHISLNFFFQKPYCKQFQQIKQI